MNLSYEKDSNIYLLQPVTLSVLETPNFEQDNLLLQASVPPTGTGKLILYLYLANCTVYKDLAGITAKLF